MIELGRCMFGSAASETRVHVGWCFWHPSVQVVTSMAHPSKRIEREREGGREGRKGRRKRERAETKGKGRYAVGAP